MFIVAALDLKDKIFVVYIAFFAIYNEVYSSHRIQIASLKIDEVPTTILTEYSDFIDIISPELVAEFPKYTKINTHVDDLINITQLLYKSIYSLGPVALEILKTYIETYLANGFIRFFKFLASVSILFIPKFNNNLCLYVNYQSLNNLTIKH